MLGHCSLSSLCSVTLRSNTHQVGSQHRRWWSHCPLPPPGCSGGEEIQIEQQQNFFSFFKTFYSKCIFTVWVSFLKNRLQEQTFCYKDKVKAATLPVLEQILTDCQEVTFAKVWTGREPWNDNTHIYLCRLLNIFPTLKDNKSMFSFAITRRYVWTNYCAHVVLGSD